MKSSIQLRLFNYSDFISYVKTIFPLYKDIRFNQIMGLVPQHFDVIIVSIVSDYSAVGIYRFAKRLIEPVNYIISIFNPWLQSKLSQEDTSFRIKGFVIRFLFPLVTLVIFSYIFLGKIVIELIGSKDFLISYEPMIILLFGYSFFLLTFWIRQYLLFNNLIRFHTYGRIIYASSFILISLFIAPKYGYNGIALSLSIAMVLQKIFEYVIFMNKLNQ